MLTKNTTTTVKSIKIEGLFELFDYNIEYPNDNNVLILTGANGFGKTQILNILFNLFNNKFLFFQQLVFKKITVELNNNVSIEISKNIKTKKVVFTFFKGVNSVDTFTLDDTFISSSLKRTRNLMKHLRSLPIERINEDTWIDQRTDKKLSLDEVVYEYANHLPIEMDLMRDILKDKIEAQKILNSINVHLIQEQRLFKTKNTKVRSYFEERTQPILVDTIQIYAEELQKLILVDTQKSYEISQSLDSSYPNRLITEKRKVSKDEYDQKIANLKAKQDKLHKYGLHDKKTQISLEYSKDDAKALLVYINDLEEKLQVFDSLFEKLDLFTDTLNNRRFTFKSIYINKTEGFYFKTSTGTTLKLNQLSSGEQHEVILLYELIFKTQPNMLVLIDEPEISLHITWQTEFLNDLLKIIKIQNFQVLMATHSSSIIDDQWDLVYTLEKTDVE